MRITISLCLLFLISCANPTTKTSEQKPKVPTDLASISLEDAGLNRDSIETLINLIYETPHKDFRGLVVLKDGQIAVEEYFNTFWRKTVHDIRSAGKSVTAMLLGIAIKDGLIESLDQDVYSLFSEEKNPSINEDYKKIKLRHLLDMSSGLDADTDNNDTPGHAGQWMGKEDWKSYLLNVPLKEEPGKNWVYADIHPLLIGLAIEEASGMSLRDYAQKKLFDPLGFEEVYWYTNAANQTGAAGNLYITTFDFAKMGMLIANKGQWEGQQIIAEDYVEAIINSKSFSDPVNKWFSIADAYGMLWYKSSRTFGKNQVDYLFASGNGGNHLVVVPDRKMVVALTSSAYGPGYGQGRTYAIMSKVFEALE